MYPDTAVLEVLRRHGVPFVVVGGHAVFFHGYERRTEDADVVWFRTPESEKVMLNALTELGAQYITNEKDPATGIERLSPVGLAFLQSHHLMMLWTAKHGYLDLFTYIPGLPTEDVKQLFETAIEVDGFKIASRDWLVRMKRAAGRTKDLADLENLPPE
jgi:hypothetical protein